LQTEYPIYLAKWNDKGTAVAFCGGERLTVYDTTKKKLLLSSKLKNDSVTYFGWSPDGDTIYTEHPNLIKELYAALPTEKSFTATKPISVSTIKAIIRMDSISPRKLSGLMRRN
jgi:hypothetical protein